MAYELPEAVKRLIVEKIRSVTELEAILLLRGRRDRAWTLAEAGKRLYVSTTLAERLFAGLVYHGFLSAHEGRYLYTAAPELDAIVVELARAYALHIVAVTNLVHASEGASALELADAAVASKKK